MSLAFAAGLAVGPFHESHLTYFQYSKRPGLATFRIVSLELIKEEWFMRRLFIALMIGAVIGTTAGCFLPAYSGDRPRRTQQLIFTSENQRAILNFWERFWHLDMPDHMSPQRVHGGVI